MKKSRALFAALPALCLAFSSASTRAQNAAPQTAMTPLETSAVTGIFDVTRAPYNAVPNDNRDDSAAIQRAIDDATKAGGGTILFRQARRLQHQFTTSMARFKIATAPTRSFAFPKFRC